MRKIILVLFCMFAFANAEGESVNYGTYKNAKIYLPIEKEFITGLKPQNPDNPRQGGYAKFRATLLLDDKKVQAELTTKMDIIRSVILDTISGFMAVDVASASGRNKFAAVATTSINAILTSGTIVGIAFSDFVVQP